MERPSSPAARRGSIAVEEVRQRIQQASVLGDRASVIEVARPQHEQLLWDRRARYKPRTGGRRHRRIEASGGDVHGDA